jgi:hypothetical protein
MMYSKILCLIMGRAGSNAISHWVHAQYPPECGALLIKDDGPFALRLLTPFYAESPTSPTVYRQENVNLKGFLPTAKDRQLPTEAVDGRIVYSWRDPWNHFASLIGFWRITNRHQTDGASYAVIRNTYVPCHKATLRNALGIERALPDDAVFLNYNRWFSDAEYRAQVAADLQLPTSDNGVNEIWKFSSFDTVTDARQLAVFDRWRAYADCEGYRQLFDDEELVDLASRFWRPPF